MSHLSPLWVLLNQLNLVTNSFSMELTPYDHKEKGSLFQVMEKISKDAKEMGLNTPETSYLRGVVEEAASFIKIIPDYKDPYALHHWTSDQFKAREGLKEVLLKAHKSAENINL